MITIKRLVAALSLLLLGCMALPGCTISKSSAAATGPAGTTAGEGTATTLHISLIFDPTTLDPAKVQDVVTSEMLMHIFEPLVRYNDKNLPEPALASSWDISTDGKTYTFHLRPDAKFSNGQPLTADDVKYSWERALAPKTASTVAANYLDGILGLKDVVAGKRADLPGVVVVDAHTLRISIDHPRGYFLGMLSYPTGYVVCKEVVAKNVGVVDEKSIIGTGPYKFAEYQQGVKLTLQANDDYWGGKPKIDRIEEPILTDPDTNYNNFATGQIDMLMEGIPFTRVAEDQQTHKFASEYHLLPQAAIDYLVMHQKLVSQFANPKVRQAFALAIDRDAIVRVAYKNIGKRADGFLPSELPASGETPPMIPYDPAKAKQLLAEAGYPNGHGFPTLTLIYRSKATVAPLACQMIKANLHDNLGLDVELQERDAASFFDDASKDRLAFYYAGWIADYPDPQDFLSTLLVSDASLNHCGYSSPGFDAACRQADASSDPAVRSRYYGQANRILMEDVGVLPIATSPRPALVHTSITGWRSNLCNVLPQTQTEKTGN